MSKTKYLDFLLGDIAMLIPIFCPDFLLPLLFAWYFENHKYIWAQTTLSTFIKNCPDYLFWNWTSTGILHFISHEIVRMTTLKKVQDIPRKFRMVKRFLITNLCKKCVFVPANFNILNIFPFIDFNCTSSTGMCICIKIIQKWWKE